MHTTGKHFLALLISLGACLLLLMQMQTAVAHDAAAGDLVIAEIGWMGTTSSATDEWLTLYNNSATAVDLSGWRLFAADGTPDIFLTGIIPPGGYFLLERTGDDTLPSIPADQIYTGGLENEGEALTLTDAAAAIVDTVDSSAGWFAGHADARVPMRRIDLQGPGSDPANWTHNPRCGTPTNSAGLTVSCPLTTTYVGKGLDAAVFFNTRVPGAVVTTTAVTTMETALLDLLASAGSRIDIALYGLNRQSVVDALIAAQQRGVTVRVVGDDEAAADAIYGSFYTQLTTAGIPLVTDSSLSAIQHNKFVVVDGQWVWTGSTNFTDTGFTLNANNSILITDTVLADIYTTEFNEMVAGSFQRSKSDNSAHLLDYNGTLVEIYFSPTDRVAFAVWERLQELENSLHFAIFFWTDDLLAAETMRGLTHGTAVWGVWDRLGGANLSSQDELLCAGGAHLGIETMPGKLHHKFGVIDVNGAHPLVILGSYNWTASGAYTNDENTLIIHDAALAQAYYQEWSRLWTAVPLAEKCNLFAAFLPFAERPWP